jgi:uncharacterized protein
VNAVQHILSFGIRLYRWVISPAMAFTFGPLARCRFTPSCSQYALDAVRIHGALRGSGLALRRICRCHPWGGCGEDAVPGGEAEGRSLKAEARRAKAQAEIRNPKSEGRKTSEIRSPKAAIRPSTETRSSAFVFRISGFGLLSAFGFRISDFRRFRAPASETHHS